MIQIEESKMLFEFKEQEEQIKGFLLIYRTHRQEHLKEGYNGGKWYYKEQIEKLGLEE